MRSLTKAGLLILFAIPIGCSGASTGSADAATGQERTRQAIRIVCAEDHRLVADVKRADASGSVARLAAAVRRYCDGLESLPLSDCPADFRVAFRHHGRAWREFQRVVEEYPDGFGEGVLVGFANAVLRGEADGGAGRMQDEVRAALRRVSLTWEEVERVAARYGVVDEQ